MTDDIRERYEAMLERITGIFRTGVAGGEFADVEPDLLTLGFEGLIRSYLARLSRTDVGTRNHGEEAKLLSIFLNGAQRHSQVQGPSNN